MAGSPAVHADPPLPISSVQVIKIGVTAETLQATSYYNTQGRVLAIAS